MDPLETLAELRRFVEALGRSPAEPDDVARMAELVDALDEFLRRTWVARR